MFGIPFLTTKFIIIGALILAALAYVGVLHIKINYYKAEAQKYENAFNDLTTRQETARKVAEEATKAQDKVREEQSKAAANEIFRLQNSHLKEIRENKRLNDIVIPDLARKLFNATSKSRLDEASPPGETNTPNVISDSTLADLLIAVENNKANYLQCAQDKEDWKTLWKETEANLAGAP